MKMNEALRKLVKIHNYKAALLAKEAASLMRALLTTKKYNGEYWSSKLEESSRELQIAKMHEEFAKFNEQAGIEDVELKDHFDMKAGDNWEDYRVPIKQILRKTYI
jgi:hypothetical protein